MEARIQTTLSVILSDVMCKPTVDWHAGSASRPPHNPAELWSNREGTLLGPANRPYDPGGVRSGLIRVRNLVAQAESPPVARAPPNLVELWSNPVGIVLGPANRPYEPGGVRPELILVRNLLAQAESPPVARAPPNLVELWSNPEGTVLGPANRPYDPGGVRSEPPGVGSKV
jgi:hypothetical protein